VGQTAASVLKYCALVEAYVIAWQSLHVPLAVLQHRSDAAQQMLMVVRSGGIISLTRSLTAQEQLVQVIFENCLCEVVFIIIN
jgi:hypothetical protein